MDPLGNPLLWRLGANVNVSGKVGDRPLHLAPAKGFFKHCKTPAGRPE